MTRIDDSALFIGRIVLLDQEVKNEAEKTVFPLRKYLEPGKFVSFGRYRVTQIIWQIKDYTPITRYVKEVRNDRALLLSRYGLEVKPYHTEAENVTRETCSLRIFVNQDLRCAYP